MAGIVFIYETDDLPFDEMTVHIILKKPEVNNAIPESVTFNTTPENAGELAEYFTRIAKILRGVYEAGVL